MNNILKNFKYKHRKDKPPIFIGGSGRSGTTLLRVMLNNHPNIFCGPETHFFIDQTFQDLYDKFILYYEKRLLEYGESAEDVVKEIYRGMFRTFYDKHTKIQHKKRWADKTPYNIKAIDFLLKIFDNDIKFIHIIRDGRDVTSSVLPMPWGPNTASVSAQSWKEIISDSRKHIGKDYFFELRYEDLLSNPEFWLRRICDFIGENYSPKMLSFYKNKNMGGNNESSFDQVQRPLNKQSIGRWKKDLLNEQVKEFMEIAGGTLCQLGYETLTVVSLYLKFILDRSDLKQVFIVGDNTLLNLDILENFNITHISLDELSEFLSKNSKKNRLKESLVYILDKNRKLSDMTDILTRLDKCVGFLLVSTDNEDLATYLEGSFVGEIPAYPKYLLLGGLQSRPIKQKNEEKDIKALAVMTVFNEEDIIGATIESLITQGLEVYILDNWSTDDTLKVIISKQKKYPSKIKVKRYPSNKNKKYRLDKIWEAMRNVAEQEDTDWVMFTDADEIRISPWKGIRLLEAFKFVGSLGYNAIDFTVFNFQPTKDGFNSSKDLEKFFQFGEFGQRSGHFRQVKAWRKEHIKHMNVTTYAAHDVLYKEKKIYPLKFFTKHYPLRSQDHALKKIFKERLPKYAKINRDKGWHTQYNDFSPQDNFIKNVNDLIKYDDKFNELYLIERLSGIGVSGNPNQQVDSNLIVERDSKDSPVVKKRRFSIKMYSSVLSIYRGIIPLRYRQKIKNILMNTSNY